MAARHVGGGLVPVEHRPLGAARAQDVERALRGPVGRVDDDRQVVPRRFGDEAREARPPAGHQVRRVRRPLEAVPREADLPHRGEPPVVLGDLRDDLLEVPVGQGRALGMKPHRRPHALAVPARQPKGLEIARRVGADRDDAPDPRLARARHHRPRVLVDEIGQMAVSVDEHPVPLLYHAPATTMRPMSTVGAAVRSRKTRSLPMPSTRLYISRRLPAIVISSTGYASSPFSIQSPTAPRE